MNQHIADVIFCTLVGSCFGAFPMSKCAGNNILLIWVCISVIAAFCSMFFDAIGLINSWYYSPIFCAMTGILSYFYLQQYGKKVK